MITKNSAPDNSSEQPEQPEQPDPVVFSRVEDATAKQISILMAVFNSTASFLAQYSPIETPSTDFDPRLTAAQTMEAAAHQMQRIVRDDARWGVDQIKTLEVALQKVYHTQQIALEEQVRATRQLSAPHVRYRPKLFRTRPGEWVAVWGDISDSDHSVSGIGATPEAAVAAFDAAFRGSMIDLTKQWAIKNQKETQDESNSRDMDDQGTSNSAPDAEKEEALHRNRQSSRTKPKSRRGKITKPRGRSDG